MGRRSSAFRELFPHCSPPIISGASLGSAGAARSDDALGFGGTIREHCAGENSLNRPDWY